MSVLRFEVVLAEVESRDVGADGRVREDLAMAVVAAVEREAKRAAKEASVEEELDVKSGFNGLEGFVRSGSLEGVDGRLKSSVLDSAWD